MPSAHRRRMSRDSLSLTVGRNETGATLPTKTLATARCARANWPAVRESPLSPQRRCGASIDVAEYESIARNRPHAEPFAQPRQVAQMWLTLRFLGISGPGGVPGTVQSACRGVKRGMPASPCRPGQGISGTGPADCALSKEWTCRLAARQECNAANGRMHDLYVRRCRTGNRKAFSSPGEVSLRVSHVARRFASLQALG